MKYQVGCHQESFANPRRRVAVVRSGFTLVEILIVVVILSILAVIVVAQFTSAADETRTNSTRMSLFRIRSQLGLYNAEHKSTYPDSANFVDQMTASTDIDGNTAEIGTTGYPFGPYLKKIPANPNTGGSTVGDGEIGTSDWHYNETTAEFHANDSTEAFEF